MRIEDYDDDYFYGSSAGPETWKEVLIVGGLVIGLLGTVVGICETIRYLFF